MRIWKNLCLSTEGESELREETILCSCKAEITACHKLLFLKDIFNKIIYRTRQMKSQSMTCLILHQTLFVFETLISAQNKFHLKRYQREHFITISVTSTFVQNTLLHVCIVFLTLSPVFDMWSLKNLVQSYHVAASDPSIWNATSYTSREWPSCDGQEQTSHQ